MIHLPHRLLTHPLRLLGRLVRDLRADPPPP
jgi:hypothetical protein